MRIPFSYSVQRAMAKSLLTSATCLALLPPAMAQQTPWCTDTAATRTACAKVVASGVKDKWGNFSMMCQMAANSYNRLNCTAQLAAPQVAPVPTEASTWTVLPGTGIDIGVGGQNDSAWVVGTNALANGFGVYRWVNNTWAEVPSTGAVRLDVDEKGNAWIVNNKGALLQYDGTKWVDVRSRPMLENIKGLTVTDAGIGANGSFWMIGTDQVGKGSIYFQQMRLPGSASRIDVDAGGTAWVVNAQGDVFRWNGSFNGNPWIHVSGVLARDIAIGAGNTVFVTGMDDKVYRWTGSAWAVRQGAANNITVSAAGVPYVVNAAGKIYRGVR